MIGLLPFRIERMRFLEDKNNLFSKLRGKAMGEETFGQIFRFPALDPVSNPNQYVF